MTKTAAPQLLSTRAFGEALGVSKQAVLKAIKTGRLSASLSKDEHTGFRRIDLVAGKNEWEAWTTPYMRAKRKAAGRPSNAEKVTPSLFDSESDRTNERERKVEQLTHARASAERVALDAELKRIELDQLRGNIVDKREVQREAFRLARALRDRLQAIPDRIAATLAALDKPAQVHETLSSEIANALQSLIEQQSEVEA